MSELHPGKSVRMNSTYRNLAIAAGGALAVAMAARIIRSYTARHPMLAQTMTVVLDRETVIDRLDDLMIQMSVGCEEIAIARDMDDNRLIEWACSSHPFESGRVALIAAPGNRGTELHVAMHGETSRVKDIVRRMKSLLETREVATGARE